ncbi:hypothetical protein C4D46_08390 [Clostridium perfringens]
MSSKSITLISDLIQTSSYKVLAENATIEKNAVAPPVTIVAIILAKAQTEYFYTRIFLYL